VGSAETLPAFDLPFDKILAVNATLSWDRPVELLRNLRRVLRPGGRIAIAFQPRGPDATDEAATARGQKLLAALRDAGFSQLRLETLELKPAVVCALGVNSPGSNDTET
jgi:SAM-dependent methyltransferase